MPAWRTATYYKISLSTKHQASPCPPTLPTCEVLDTPFFKMATDIENQLDNEDLGRVDATEPLLPKPDRDRSSNKSSRRNRRSLEVIELDDIPPIIKSANGNIFWADEQCTRRVGLTSTEARLFLKLLQTDEPENYNYQDYKEMFDDFGAEQARLKELVKRLPWYKFDTYRQRAIWKARIEWLERMKEPRLWLLYLMARRRRILKQASMRVLNRLAEKRRWKMENGGHFERGRPPPDLRPPAPPSDHEEIRGLGMVMLSEATQTSTPMDTSPAPPPSPGSQASRPPPSRDAQASPPPPPSRGNHQAATSDATQISETRLGHITSRIRDSLSASRHRHSPRSSQGQCPIFEKPFEATREDIKRHVEEIMPKFTPYIVIGWFHRSAGDPMERILQFEQPEQLFHSMRRGEYQVRGYREYFSLKSLRGFGLYKVRIILTLGRYKTNLCSVISHVEHIFHSCSTRPKKPFLPSSFMHTMLRTDMQMMMLLELGTAGSSKILTTAKRTPLKVGTRYSCFTTGQAIG